jgi:hypothetical protein
LSINKTNFNLNDSWYLYVSGAKPNQPVTLCAIDNKGVQSCTPAANLGLPAILIYLVIGLQVVVGLKMEFLILQY